MPLVFSVCFMLEVLMYSSSCVAVQCGVLAFNWPCSRAAEDREAG